MKRFCILISFFAPLFTTACSEETDLRSKAEHYERLAVEAILTNREDRPQRVVLTKTVPYFGETSPIGIQGALVTVSDGEEDVRFADKGAGVYEAPEGYHGEQGKDYHLTIALQDGTVYDADASMPHDGFRIDAIDYAFAGDKKMGLDSLWTLAIWGEDMETTDYYYITAGVNGEFYPFEMAEVTDDIYFSGNTINGFPITTLTQYSSTRELYGDCAKYLEEGDVVTVEAMTLSRDYYDYLMAILLNGAFSAIPLFSPQPANCPTNIKGGDGNVVGYFAACPVVSSSVTIDDPFRPYYREASQE
ncbi:MAG: DUF4249 domain-containing protein [Bacteroidales bacterium]|nr:DUF4249 domain-containing protein [Bacteroidales bacterium]